MIGFIGFISTKWLGEHSQQKKDVQPKIYRMKLWATNEVQVLVLPKETEEDFREEPRTTVSVCVTRAEPGTTTCTRSSVRFPCIQIIKTATVPASLCNRESTKQFHISKIKFPLVFRKVRPPNRKLKTTYKASKPTFSCKTSLCMILYSSLSTRDQVSVLVPQSL
ncbi:hypothetical protein F2Q69_00038357 [Brassica cretica]|uniref:Uncharacterized protein n=1 Tax=Brassica cretica TaxID=69181 RepID=A0A8S9SHW1_BRACR|nr:hypothetical protein F2Q69_00038357 [Brassica cretica]